MEKENKRFKEKAKQIVKDILGSIDMKDDPIQTLMEVYIENKLKEAYKLGFEDFTKTTNGKRN